MRVATDGELNHWEQAFSWLCQRRRNMPANDGIWHLRYHWRQQADVLLEAVLNNRYRLSPMYCVGGGAKRHPVWCAEDALVLKWLTFRVTQWFPISPRCAHVKGHGGIIGAQRAAQEAVITHDGGFVFRTDIYGYYRHIQRGALLALFQRYVADTACHALLTQFAHYCVEDAGLFHQPQGGLPRGASLSPLLGAALLTELDHRLDSMPGVWYLRYMDDFLLLTKRRWPLRRAICLLTSQLASEGFSRHPDKTQIGRLARGFDWLGLAYNGSCWAVAPRALGQHQQRCTERYGSARRHGLSVSQALLRVGDYRARWQQWLAHILPK